MTLAPSTTQSTSLSGLWSVVTGSSAGIGQAIALELAHAGSNVIVHGFQQAVAAEQLAEKIQKLGRESRVLLGDLSLSAIRDQLCSQAWDIAPIDIWINNAGSDVLTGTAAELSFGEKLDRLWKVDVQATIQMSRDIGARMRQRSFGTILNIGWDQADTGMAGDSGEMFAATKGAIMAFTRSLSKSLAPQVRVNCLAPGWIQTAWSETASEYWQQRAVSESLLQRWGTPTDVARTARFLVSPDASFITGQIIHVNGGQHR